MRLKAQQSFTKLGKISLLLIALTFVFWLFVNNAQNCLSRDFVEQAPPAICWRETNDYESTINYSQVVYLCLLVLAIVISAVTFSRMNIRRSATTKTEKRKTALFLATFSSLLLLFIVTIFIVWQRTAYNNNNYALNTATHLVVSIGSPIWLAVTSAAATYGLSSIKRDSV